MISKNRVLNRKKIIKPLMYCKISRKAPEEFRVEKIKPQLLEIWLSLSLSRKSLLSV